MITKLEDGVCLTIQEAAQWAGISRMQMLRYTKPSKTRECRMDILKFRINKRNGRKVFDGKELNRFFFNSI
jgi:hypothetical protein